MYILFLAVALLTTTYLFNLKHTLTAACFIILFFLIGLYSGSLKLEINTKQHFTNDTAVQYLVKIINQPIEKENTYQLTVDVMQSQTEIQTGKALIYLKKNNICKLLNHGDQLIVENNFKAISSNKNPYEFDYQRYLKIHSIFYQAYLTDKQWQVAKTSEHTFYKSILSVRKKLDSWISNSILSDQNKKVAKALLLGEKEYLDPDTLKSFSSAGAMHVLAVSGLHVGIIMIILQFVLKPVKKIKLGKPFYTALIIVGVWLYALITGFSPSVIRAALMFSFIVFGMGLQRQNSVYQSIFVSAFIILLFDPFSLFKVGFQLSYLAVLGIVYIQPKIYALFYVNSKVLDYLWQISSVSIAAQLATFPLGLYYFHQFPNLFLVSNIIVIPLAGILLSLGFIYFILHFIEPARVVLEYILNLAFTFLNKSVEAIESIPNSLILGISISWIDVFVIYGIIGSLTISFIKKSKRLLAIGLLTVILFLSIKLTDKKSMESQRYFTCYNIKKDFALDIFEGHENTFLSTESLLKNDSKLLFHVKHNWYQNRGNEIPSKLISIKKYNNPTLNLTEKLSLSVINNINVPIPVSNYVILYQADFLAETTLKRWQENGTQLILHPDLKYAVAKFCKRSYPSELLFDIKEEGAFTLNYK